MSNTVDKIRYAAVRAIVDKIKQIKKATDDPAFYKRIAVVKLSDRLTKNNERLNQAILDLEDFVNGGEDMLTRRQFLKNAAGRAFRRLQPFNTPSHDPFEQLNDVVDSRISRKIARETGKHVEFSYKPYYAFTRRRRSNYI